MIKIAFMLIFYSLNIIDLNGLIIHVLIVIIYINNNNFHNNI